MNSILQKEFMKFIKLLNDNDCLKDLILIGSWSEYVYMQSGSSDRDSTDTLNHLTSLSASDEYKFTYTDRTYSGYHEDAYYSCVVSDLDTFAEKVFNIIKEDIQKGKLV